MRNCPSCSSPLAPVEYEGFRVLRCAQCSGHLVGFAELESIKAVAGKTHEELKAEASAGFHGSTTARIHCPRCHLEMAKHALRLPGLELDTDVCRPCSLVWLDGGELALAQLGYEAGTAFRDSQTMKQRMAELEADPQRKAAFEARLAALPAEPSSDGNSAGDLLQDAVEDAGWNVLMDAVAAIIRKAVFK